MDDPLADEVFSIFDVIDSQILSEKSYLSESQVPNSLDFATCTIVFNNPFYYDKDNDNGDVFKNIWEEVECDINPNIYNKLVIASEWVIKREYWTGSWWIQL